MTANIDSKLTIDGAQMISVFEQMNKSLKILAEGSSKVGTASSEAAEKAKTKWEELNAKYQFFTKGLSDGIGLLTKFKDTILEMEGFQTQATALSKMSRAGEDLNSVLANSVEITKGVVNQYDILAATNNLMMKGFNLSEESLTKLIDVSAIYSSVTGEAVSTVMGKIASASQRERDSLFEKMGVYISTKDVLDVYAKSIGKTVDQLDEATKSSVLLETATDKMKVKFEETGLSAASLESPITHTFKRAETSIKQAQDAAVAFAATLYVDVVDAVEYLMLRQKASNAQIWKMDDEQKAKTQMALLKSEMQKLAADEAKRVADYKALSFSEQEKNKEQEQKGSKAFEDKLDGLLKKVQAFKDEVGVGAYGDAYGFLSQETADQIQAMESQIAGIGTLVVEKVKAIESLKQNAKKSWVDFADLPADEKKEKETGKADAVKDDWEEVYNATVDEQKKLTELEQKNTDDEHRKEVDAINAKTELLKAGYEIERDIATQQSEWKKKLAEFDKKEAEKIEKKKVKSFLDEEFKLQDEKERLQKMGLQKSAQFTSMLINDVLLGEKEFRKEMIGDFVKGIGEQMVADGTFHVFAGLAKAWVNPAAGFGEAKAGAAEVGAGIAMGATAKAIGTTSSESESKSKETAAADRNSTKGDQKQKMDVYLYPDEKRWLRSLNKSNNKLGVQRGR